MLITTGCNNQNNKEKLIIFHAGSLSVPFKKLKADFEKRYPHIEVQLEASGSRTCARKITDLNKPCDIMASADYKVIDNLLIPNYALWNLKFAANEMVIAYTEKSGYANEITSSNWHKILLQSNVSFGRSDPDSDPCGYRTVLVTKLAEIYCNQPGLADSILNKNKEHIRPKEVDLLALLESETIDYIFIYRSVAKQHQLQYVILPDSINLKSTHLSNYYSQVSVDISGKKPGDKITHHGDAMTYGITQINDAPNPVAAQKFLKFFFIDSIGIKRLETCGQPNVTPAFCQQFDELPEYLRGFATH